MVKKAAQAKPNELLRNARKERGWTQKGVADRIGAPLALNVTRWERGTAFPSAYYVERLCQLFGKSAGELGLIQDQSPQISRPSGPSDDVATAPTQLLSPPRLPLPTNDATIAPTQLLSPPRRHPLTPKIILLAALVLLLVAASAGLLYITYGNSNNTHHLPVVKPTRAISAIDATATAHTAPTATFVAAYPDPYPPYAGKIAFYDPLTEPYLWKNEYNSSTGLSCQFKQGTYDVTETQFSTGMCFNQDFDGANVTMEVQMKVIQGDCGGIILRSNEPDDYQFEVCQDGYYDFAVYKDKTSPKELVYKTSPAIIIGFNQLNVIAIVAKDNTFDLYVNQQKIDTIHDSSYSHGLIGLISTGSSPPSTSEVVYSHVKVWKL